MSQWKIPRHKITRQEAMDEGQKGARSTRVFCKEGRVLDYVRYLPKLSLARTYL